MQETTLSVIWGSFLHSSMWMLQPKYYILRGTQRTQSYQSQSRKKISWHQFSIQPNQKHSLFLNMQALTTFAYSAFFLTHHQNRDGGHNNINISSYGNQRLFFNARKSIKRINCNLTPAIPSDKNLDQLIN